MQIFIYGEIGYYARNYTWDGVRKERLNIYLQLELLEEVDIVSVATKALQRIVIYVVYLVEMILILPKKVIF